MLNALLSWVLFENKGGTPNQEYVLQKDLWWYMSCALKGIWDIICLSRKMNILDVEGFCGKVNSCEISAE